MSKEHIMIQLKPENKNNEKFLKSMLEARFQKLSRETYFHVPSVKFFRGNTSSLSRVSGAPELVLFGKV